MRDRPRGARCYESDEDDQANQPHWRLLYALLIARSVAHYVTWGTPRGRHPGPHQTAFVSARFTKVQPEITRRHWALGPQSLPNADSLRSEPRESLLLTKSPTKYHSQVHATARVRLGQNRRPRRNDCGKPNASDQRPRKSGLPPTVKRSAASDGWAFEPDA